MKISAILHTGHYRGDHEADVEEAHDVAPGETVEHFVARLIREDRSVCDKIVLRRVIECQREGTSR